MSGVTVKLSDVTVLGRVPIDPRYPTTLAIGALALTVTIAVTAFQLISGAALMESAARGVGAGFTLFLTWALGRELDPDHDLSAFVGAGLAIASMLFIEEPSLSLILWLLLVLRTVNRTVGLPARPLDSLAVLGFGAWLTWQGDWMAGLVTVVAFLLDGLLSPPHRTRILVSGLAFVATVVLSVLHGDMAMENGPSVAVVIAVIVMAGSFILVISTTRQLRAVADATGEPLNPRRVQAAQSLALATALLFAWWDRASGVVALLPLWAAMIGASLYRLAILVLRRVR